MPNLPKHGQAAVLCTSLTWKEDEMHQWRQPRDIHDGQELTGVPSSPDINWSEQNSCFVFPWWNIAADAIVEVMDRRACSHRWQVTSLQIQGTKSPKILISSCLSLFLCVCVCAKYTPQDLHISPWTLQNSKGSRNDSKLLSMLSKECKSGNSTLKARAGKSILPTAKHFTFNIFEPAYETISLAKTTFPH